MGGCASKSTNTPKPAGGASASTKEASKVASPKSVQQSRPSLKEAQRSTLRKLAGEDIDKYYEIGKRLGSGSFAVVRLARRKADGKLVAIKVIKKARLKPKDLEVLHEEVEIMAKVDHPNIVHLEEFFETPKRLYIVMELLTGGEVFDRIVNKGSYSEAEAAKLIKDVANALKYLHSQGIAHRDLKPENLLIINESGDTVKITDFGLAKLKSGVEQKANILTTACGTPGYVAPEVLKQQKYGPAVDLWSLGVILYILLCGFPPFYHESTSELYKQIKKGKYDFPSPYWDNVSDAAKDLVKHLLTVEPLQRYDADQVLQHPWVQEGGAPSKTFSAAHNEQLRGTQVRKALRVAIRMVIAINRLLKALQGQDKSQRVEPPMKRLVDEEVTNEYQELFALFDKNGDGSIQANEFHEVLSKFSSKEIRIDDVKKLSARYDNDENGVIEFEEFLSMMMGTAVSANNNGIPSEAELKEAFEYFDTDKSGDIDSSELIAVFQALWTNNVYLQTLEEKLKTHKTIDFPFFCSLMTE